MGQCAHEKKLVVWTEGEPLHHWGKSDLVDAGSCSATGEIKVASLYLIVFTFFATPGGVSSRECGGGGWIFEKSSHEMISSKGGKVDLRDKHRIVQLH